MASFGRRLAALRKEIKLSQTELAKQLNTSVSVISRYERDEMTPSVATALKLAELLQTTVGYLLGETDDADLFKDPSMLQRFKEIATLPDEDKTALLRNLDAFLRDFKTRKAYAS